MKEKLYISDSTMLKFVEQKAGIPQTYPIELKEELPYFEYLYQHLKEIWYGLMIHQARESSRLRNLRIDNFIKKYQKEWNDQLWGSIFYDQTHPYDEKDPNRKYGPYHIVKIGQYTVEHDFDNTPQFAV
jgi:hypothetical protein